MLGLLMISLAPIVLIAIFIYYRDKYEKEPIKLLIKCLIAGMVITVPIILVESALSTFSELFRGRNFTAYNAFVIAAFTEETFKLLALFLLIWTNKNFNEKFDGIVYAVFISLGFAAVENVLYVTQHGWTVGLMRAITAVPAHALFGIVMGYHFGQAKFHLGRKRNQILLALLFPIILHGIYDYLLMSGNNIYLIAFIPYILFLWIFGFKRMVSLSKRSIFRKKYS